MRVRRSASIIECAIRSSNKHNRQHRYNTFLLLLLPAGKSQNHQDKGDFQHPAACCTWLDVLHARQLTEHFCLHRISTKCPPFLGSNKTSLTIHALRGIITQNIIGQPKGPSQSAATGLGGLFLFCVHYNIFF